MKQRGREFPIEDLHTYVNVIYVQLTKYSVSYRGIMQKWSGHPFLTNKNECGYACVGFETGFTNLYLTSLSESPSWIHH